MLHGRFLHYVGGLVIITVVFLLGVSVGSEYKNSDSNTYLQGQAQPIASLMIDYGDGRVNTYEDLLGTTAFDVVRQAADKNGFDLKYKDYGGELGVFIESINGVGADPSGKKWWQFWVNNTYSNVGASSHTIQPNDVIEFKYIQGQL